LRCRLEWIGLRTTGMELPSLSLSEPMPAVGMFDIVVRLLVLRAFRFLGRKFWKTTYKGIDVCEAAAINTTRLGSLLPRPTIDFIKWRK